MSQERDSRLIPFHALHRALIDFEVLWVHIVPNFLGFTSTEDPLRKAMLLKAPHPIWWLKKFNPFLLHCCNTLLILDHIGLNFGGGWRLQLLKACELISLDVAGTLARSA